MRLYVGNLALVTTSRDILDVFKSYKPKDCSVSKGSKKAFAIVHVEDGEAAVRNLDGVLVNGEPVKVLEAVDKKKQCGEIL